MKKGLCVFMVVALLMIIFSINVSAISQKDAIKWLESQVGAEYKNKYGAQCVCFVTAYMNWCVTGNPNSGTYPTYNAVEYPNIARNDSANWEVITNYLEFVPQPGDIFVTKGLDPKYGHVGVVLSSDINNARIIDQNGVNASDYGSPAAIHTISWTKAYSPTYYIRYKGFSNSSAAIGGAVAGATSGGSSQSNVSFSLDTSSNVINNTDARVYTWLTKTPGQNVTNAGIYIWPSSGSAPSSPTYSESFAANNNFSTRDKVHINYTIGSGKEVNYKLSEGTKYSYKIYCKVDGKEYATSVGDFTTKGTSIVDVSNVRFYNDTPSLVENYTDARVYAWLYKKPGQNITKAGIYLWKNGENAPSSPTYTEDFAKHNNFIDREQVHINYVIGSGKEANYKLLEGTSYSYKMYCVVEGKEFVTQVGTFKTKGQQPTTSVGKFILTIGEKTAEVWGNIKTNDVAPKLVNGRTMLPARFVAENLGAKVVWDAAENKVTISTDQIDIIIFVGSDRAYINGKKYVLDAFAFVENGRTYTPVRFIAEALGAKVDWNERTQQVIITK